MTCKYQPDLVDVEIYCECGEILRQVERINYNSYITVKPCPRCMKEAADKEERQ